MVMQKTASSQRSESPKTILVVDDNVYMRLMLEKMMHSNTHYHAIIVSNCTEALEIAEIIKPDLFLFDYQMPDMSGLEIYDKLHAKKALKNVPAIIMSSALPQIEIEKRNILGVEKPFHLNVLFRMIDSVVQSPHNKPTNQSNFGSITTLPLNL